MIPKKKKKKNALMRKDKTSRLKPLLMPHANCSFFIVHILFTVSRFPFFLPLPAAATKKTAAPPDVVQ